MSSKSVFKGQIVDEQMLITLEELCHHCTVQADEVITLVKEGILDPKDAAPDPASAQHWHFHISSVRRVRTSVHLQRDLGVNLPGVALVLELLDRIAEIQKSN